VTGIPVPVILVPPHCHSRRAAAIAAAREGNPGVRYRHGGYHLGPLPSRSRRSRSPEMTFRGRLTVCQPDRALIRLTAPLILGLCPIRRELGMLSQLPDYLEWKARQHRARGRRRMLKTLATAAVFLVAFAAAWKYLPRSMSRKIHSDPNYSLNMVKLVRRNLS